jgi:hypothetical protein
MVTLRRLLPRFVLKPKLGTMSRLTKARKACVQRESIVTHWVQHLSLHARSVARASIAQLDPQVAPSVPQDDLAIPPVRRQKQAAASVSLVSTPTLKVLPSASHAQEAKHHSDLALLFAWFALQESTGRLVTLAWIAWMGSLPLQERQNAPLPNLDSTRMLIKRSR